MNHIQGVQILLYPIISTFWGFFLLLSYFLGFVLLILLFGIFPTFRLFFNFSYFLAFFLVLGFNFHTHYNEHENLQDSGVIFGLWGVKFPVGRFGF